MNSHYICVVFTDDDDNGKANLVYHMIKTKTRSSADADNRIDAFSGQSRSRNMIPFHVLHVTALNVTP